MSAEQAAVFALRRQLWASGYRPLAVYTAEKRPFGNDWPDRARLDPPEAATAIPQLGALNTGVLCDGLRAIDIDIDDPNLADKVGTLTINMLGDARVRWRADSPRRLVLYRAAEGEPGKRSLQGSYGEVEVLGRGQQFVAYGTHPAGEAHQWRPADPALYHRDTLNAVTEGQIHAFLTAVAPLLGAEAPKPPIVPPKPNTLVHGYVAVGGSATEYERKYAAKALENEVAKLAGMQPGSGRNQGLNDAALRMGEMVAAGWVDRKVVEAILFDAAKANGYRAKKGDRAAWATLQSGLTAGMKNPRPQLPAPEILDCVREFVAQGQFRVKTMSQATNAGSPNGWPAPKPLPLGLSPVDAFDPAFLPVSIAPWVMDIAERMQCPPDFVAVSAMVALGAAIGRQVGIRPKPKDDWTVIPNLWGMIVGRPGVMKSPAMSEAIASLRRLEAKAWEAHQSELGNYRAALQESALRKAALKDIAKKELSKNPSAALSVMLPDELIEPKPKRLIVSDATYEALGEILMSNPNGLLTFRDELISLLKTLDREEYVAARGFYLSGWSGTDGYTFDRIGRGHQHIDAVCLSILGSTQPGRLATYISRALRGGDGDDGMIQRFGLLVWPDQSSNWRHVDRFPDSAARLTAAHVFDRLSSLNTSDAMPDRFGASTQVYFDANAAARFLDWLTALEQRLRAGTLHVALESHLGKYRKLVPALALINQLTDAGISPVTVSALDRAIAFARYLETHAQRAYGAGLQMEVVTATAIVAHIRNGDLTANFTLRDIHQRDWSNLTDREQVRAGLNLLIDLDWLAVTRIETGGRPKLLHRINPRARS